VAAGGKGAQPERMRRIGVLMNLAADDPESAARMTTLAQGLAHLGWTVGRNVQIDYRWAVGDPELFRRYAGELVALAPDVIVAQGVVAVRPLLQATPHCADRVRECNRSGRHGHR
jgi:hypothetical protein